MASSLLTRINRLLRNTAHPQRNYLTRILSGRTSLSTTGYPYISERSFQLFLDYVPHLFADGNALLKWLNQAEKQMEKSDHFSKKEKDAFNQATRVIRTIVYSASICAPPDLWILRHVLSVHAQIGTLQEFALGRKINIETLADRNQLDPHHLSWDFSLLHCRGFLLQHGKSFAGSPHVLSARIFHEISPIPDEFLQDMVEPIILALSGKECDDSSSSLLKRFFTYDASVRRSSGWAPSVHDLETGYRLVPLVLAIHALKVTRELSDNSNLFDRLPFTREMRMLLSAAGIVKRDGKLTPLGLRVFQRGPGPFGIIHAYMPYMRVLYNRLTKQGAKTWVQRGKNIAASQDANRKTFEMANDSFDRFQKDHEFTSNVFIEHALGHGEATRQRFQRPGGDRFQYFGADLEDAAIDKAVALQQQGTLPQNMKFIRNADIAEPRIVIDAVRTAGFSTENAVMFVGNGFHEVRGQTNQKIVDVFRGYCDAGIIIIFTEESALGDYDLLHTGWNTYHAGFRYVHELSGQGLRPVFGTDRFGRQSWKICASLGGYAVLSKYCAHTRTIYPFPRKGGYNPPISMTYFCVPASIARSLGYFPRNWSHSREGTQIS